MLLLNLILLIEVTFSTPTGVYTQNPRPRHFECFYEKVIKVKADVAALPHLFLLHLASRNPPEGGELSRALPLGNVHLDP